MKTKMVKKLFAVVLSAAMVMGMSATVMAADTTTGEAPIYSFDVENVVVPTTFVTAFNPDGLVVRKPDGTTSTAPIQSMNYGILNKSSKDKIVTVDLTITDKNATGTNPGVTFVNSKSNIDSATKGAYAIHLTAIPADATKNVVTTPTAPATTTQAAALGRVEMDPAADSTTTRPTLKAGSNQMAFKLEKGVYEGEVVLGTDETVGSKYKLKALAASGKGMTGFTFGGEMNPNADWTKMTKKIEITATYTFSNAEGTETPISGTGALVPVADQAPTFSSSAIGVIDIVGGSGDKAFASLEVLTGPWQGKPFDLKPKATVAADKTKITIDTATLAGWASSKINPTVTIKYTNVGGTEVTETAELKTY